MIRKLFISILLINIIAIYSIFNFIYPKINDSENLKKQIVDIKNTNDLINAYSNLVMEIVPADE